MVQFYITLLMILMDYLLWVILKFKNFQLIPQTLRLLIPKPQIQEIHNDFLLCYRVPKIVLKNGRGLSDQQIAVLYDELVELTKRLQGEVMILELAQHVQKYLYENNKRRYNSFYEEMISRHQEKIQYEMLEKQLKEDKERQVGHASIRARVSYTKMPVYLYTNFRYYKMKYKKGKKL